MNKQFGRFDGHWNYFSSRTAVYLSEHGIQFGLPEYVKGCIEADAMGFKQVHVAHSLSAKPRWAALPLMAYIAAQTEHIKLGSTILQPNLYNNPLLLAQELITIDHLTEGRFVPGFGLARAVATWLNRNSPQLAWRKKPGASALPRTWKCLTCC